MRIKEIMILTIFVLSGFYSCSAQKELQQERCRVLKDVMPATYKIRIMNWILSISDMTEKRPHFNSMQYFKLDSFESYDLFFLRKKSTNLLVYYIFFLFLLT